MRITLRINPRTHLACIPNSVVEDGMIGNVDAYADAVTLTLVSPKATLEDVKISLHTIMMEIEHRIDLVKRGRESEVQR